MATKRLLKKGVKKIGDGALMYFLPSSSKRAVFLSTVFIEVAKLSPEHKELLRTLDERFNLTKNQKGCVIPPALHDFIWEDRHLVIRDVEKNLSEEELTGLCQRIIKKSPQWCHYANNEDVLKETREVVRTALEERHRLSPC